MTRHLFYLYPIVGDGRLTVRVALDPNQPRRAMLAVAWRWAYEPSPVEKASALLATPITTTENETPPGAA